MLKRMLLILAVAAGLCGLTIPSQAAVPVPNYWHWYKGKVTLAAAYQYHAYVSVEVGVKAVPDRWGNVRALAIIARQHSNAWTRPWGYMGLAVHVVVVDDRTVVRPSVANVWVAHTDGDGASTAFKPIVARPIENRPRAVIMVTAVVNNAPDAKSLSPLYRDRVYLPLYGRL